VSYHCSERLCSNTEYRIDDVKDSFCEEFDKFLKYYTKMLLGDFNATVGRKDLSKPITGNDS
jgi:hypothetical protein